MSVELGVMIGVAVALYLFGMLQTRNAIIFYANAPYFDRECGYFGACVGLLLWPVVAVALLFMYEAERKEIQRRKP